MQINPMAKTRGGARVGAGRKKGSGPLKTPTVPIRVPIDQALSIKKWLKDLSAMGDLEAAYLPPLKLSAKTCPIFSTKVSAGFPSPADDHQEKMLDLNAYLINNQPCTFFLIVSGDSMTGAGILHGDLLVVDKSLNPSNGQIIIAVLNGETTVKRLKINKKNVITLVPENSNYQELEINEEMDFKIWGVVTSVIRKF